MTATGDRPCRSRLPDEGRGRLLSPVAVLALLGCFLLAAPTIDWLPELTWHDLQRLAQIATLVAVLPLTVISRPLRHAVRLQWRVLPAMIRHLLVLALVCGFMSSLAAQFPLWALLEWGLWVALCGLFLVVAAARKMTGPGADVALMLLLLMLISALAAKSLASYAAMLGHGRLFAVNELYGGFSNIRFFGHVQTMTLPFLLAALMVWDRRPGYWALLFVLTALWWCLVIASGTRGTWLGLAAAAIAVGSLNVNTAARWVKTGGLTALAGAAMYLVLILWLPGVLLDAAPGPVPRAGSLLSLSGRDLIWSRAVEHWLAHPLLGVGPMHFAALSADIGMHPHNLVLQWLAEWGTPASLCWCTALLFAARALIRKTRLACGDHRYPRGGPLMIAVTAALAGAAIQSLVDGVMVMPVSQMLVVVLAGWAAGFSGGLEQGSAGEGISGRGGVVALTLPLLMLALLAVKAEPLIEALGKLQQKHDSKEHPEIVLPRFWAQGSIGAGSAGSVRDRR